MNITFLVPDVAGPVIGPVTVLARTLRKHWPVEIVGPDLGSGVHPMYRGEFDYVAVKTPRLYRFPEFFSGARALSNAIHGDVVVAVKAFVHTVGLAWWEKTRRSRRMVVYLDEWDGALYRSLSPAARAGAWLRHVHHPLDDVYHPWVEKLIPRADLVLSTSTFLREKFGGRIVHMGVDMEQFRPQTGTPALREELGLQELKLIVFGGVVRPHKGLELVLDALALLQNDRYRLAVVGPVNAHLEELRRDPRRGRFLIALGAQPKSSMPRFLDLADLVVLPLQDTLLARSQVPCKVFEAMAMAKPIIASAVSDLPAMLEGCGWVVPPGDVEALARQIDEVFRDPVEAGRRGEAARLRCRERYAQEATERELVDCFAGLT